MRNLIIVLLSIALVSAAVLLQKPLRENFWGLPGRTVKRDREYKVENTYASPMFSVPPTYQGMLSPRFSNVDYGANILYNIPAREHLASPEYPLTFQGDVKEGYASAGADKMNNLQAVKTFAANAQNGFFAVGKPEEVEGAVNAMNAGSTMPSQILNYDRLIFANQRSRLYGRGDPIRGDLPIVPVNDGWFRPSVQANIDLRQGAINVIAGAENNTANALRALQAEWSGKTALAQKEISLGAAQGDVIVTAFP